MHPHKNFRDLPQVKKNMLHSPLHPQKQNKPRRRPLNPPQNPLQNPLQNHKNSTKPLQNPCITPKPSHGVPKKPQRKMLKPLKIWGIGSFVGVFGGRKKPLQISKKSKNSGLKAFVVAPSVPFFLAAGRTPAKKKWDWKWHCKSLQTTIFTFFLKFAGAFVEVL